MALAHGMGVVQNFIVLSVVYYIALAPLALFIRLSRRDLLALRRIDRPTFYSPKERIPTDLERCERQF